MKSEIVRARIDSRIKDEATQVLEAMGLGVSDAIRILFARIAADKAFPFERRAPSDSERSVIAARARDA